MKKFLSILLCMLIFMCYFIFELSMNFSLAFSEKSINNISKNITLTNNMKPEDITPENLYWQTTLNTIYDIADDYNVSKEKVDNLLESDNTREFIANYLNKISTSIINNKDELTKENIEKHFNESLDKYLENNSDISDKDKINIKNFVDDNKNKIIDKIPPTSQITNNVNPELLDFIQSFFSIRTKLILGAIILISIIGIVLMQFKNNKWLLYLGSIILISSIFNLLFSLTVNPFVEVLIDYDSNIVNSMTQLFSKAVTKSYTITNIIGILVSILILIIYNIIKRKKDL